jgi:hypothetical protein
VDGSDFVLEGGVDEAVALERVEALELGRNDEGVEGLSAAACVRVCKFSNSEVLPWTVGGVGRGEERTRHVSDFDVNGAQTLGDGFADAFVCDLRHEADLLGACVVCASACAGDI